MIQRIQSIWLLLAAVFAAITFRFPFYSGERVTDTVNNLSAHADLNANTNIWLTILTILAGGLAFVAVFFYDNRKRQLKFAYAGIAFTILLLVVYFLQIGKFVSGQGTFALSCILYFAILGFYILAIRGIMKDEKLIKSMDRLR